MKYFFAALSLLALYEVNAVDQVIFHYAIEEDTSSVLVKKYGFTGESVGGYRVPATASWTPKQPKDFPLGPHLTTVRDLLLPLDRMPGGAATAAFVPLQEIFRSAMIVQKAAHTERPDCIFGLGRAPTFIMETLRHLCARDAAAEMPKLFSVAFSGSPDIESVNGVRASELLLKNVLNGKRVGVFFDYLDSLGFQNFQKVWCIDVITTGAGLNSFLRLLRRYYHNKGRDFPEFRFWACNIPPFTVPLEKFCIYDHTAKTLTFDATKTAWGYQPMTISTYTLAMADGASHIMDEGATENLYAAVSAYSACQMKALTVSGSADPRGASTHFELFRTHVLGPAVTWLLEKGRRALEPLSGDDRQDFFTYLLQEIPEKSRLCGLPAPLMLQNYYCDECTASPFAYAYSLMRRGAGPKIDAWFQECLKEASPPKACLH